MIQKMLGQTQIKEDVEGSTVSELVTSLKSAFQNAYFTQVEEALMSREEKLKREIEGKNRENKLLVEKLQRVQKECGELKELALNVSEERDGLLKRVKESEDDKKEIIQLKRKNDKLQFAKSKAETELEALKGKFVVLDEKVSCLEKDREMLNRLESGELNRLVSGEGVLVEMETETETGKDAVVDLPMDTNAGKTKANEEAESTLNVVEETGKFDSDERPEKSPNLSGGSPRRKRTENRRPLSKDIIEIIDSDDESISHESAEGTVTEEHLHKTDSRQNVACNEAAVHKSTSASSLGVDDGRPTERGKQVSVKNVHKRTSASSVDVDDGNPTKRRRRDSGKDVSKDEPAVLKRTSASPMQNEDGRPTERGKQGLEKNVIEIEPSVLGRTSGSPMRDKNGRRTERGKQVSGKNNIEIEPSVLRRTSACPVNVDGSHPTSRKNVAQNEAVVLNVYESRLTEKYKRNLANNVTGIEPAVLKRTSTPSMDVDDARSAGRGARDSEKITENEPAVAKRTSGSSVVVADSHPSERGEHEPFASPVEHHSPAALNIGIPYPRNGAPSDELSKVLNELGDDSSSSSSSDDEVDLDVDYSTIYKPVLFD